MDSDKGIKIKELRNIEMQLQNFLVQSRNLEMELNEIRNALKEIEKTSDAVYRIISGIMIKSDKEKLKKDLKDKENKIKIKIESIQKQEKTVEDMASKLKKEISSK